MVLFGLLGQRASSTEGAGTDPLVLIVEDDDSVRMIYTRLCERGGFKVENAADAPDALEKALRLRPAAILLDLILPSMPGWELTKRLRGDDRTCGIPILVTSALGSGEAERKARAAGANGFLSKPFDGQTLLWHLRQLLAPA